MVPKSNRLDAWVPKSEHAAKLLEYIELYVLRNGGAVYGSGLTPEGWNLFGHAPTEVLDFLEKEGKQKGFRIDRNEETMTQLVEEEASAESSI